MKITNKLSLTGQVISINDQLYSLTDYKPNNILIHIPPVLNLVLDVNKVKFGTRVKINSSVR